MDNKLRFGLAASLLMMISTSTFAADCEIKRITEFKHKEIGNITIFRHQDTGAVLFASIMHVNPDGAPDAYHPEDNGTVHLCNGMTVGYTCQQNGPWKANCMADYRKAKSENFSGANPICFFAMATTKNGAPIVQGNDDPNPGYFVSMTRLSQPGGDGLRPSGQVNSNLVPFAVIPGSWQNGKGPGPKLGDFGVAFRKSNGKIAYFVVADTGPRNKLGEGSVALLQALGHDPFVMRKGKRRAFSGIGSRDIVYAIFPGTSEPAAPVSAQSVAAKGRVLLDSLGAIDGMKKCAAKL